MTGDICAIRGLYAITPDEPDTKRLITLVEAALTGGASLVQYRNKQASAELRSEQARALRALCSRWQRPLIINDNVQLCLAVDADGVHMGAEDGDLREARARLGTRLLGASCYGDLDLALTAQERGADYVAFGACFASTTKPAARTVELPIFAAGSNTLHVPRVAIGGITVNNAAAVVRAGADAIAVIGALFGSDDVETDVETVARQFSSLFKK